MMLQNSSAGFASAHKTLLNVRGDFSPFPHDILFVQQPEDEGRDEEDTKIKSDRDRKAERSKGRDLGQKKRVVQ